MKYCENAWGAYCSDSDRDGISDEDDDYFLTPPGSKTNQDEDSDGIPDDLDLCPWNDIVLTGNLDEDKFISVIDAGKQELTIKSSLNITQVEILPLKNNNGFWYFSEDDSRNFDETVFQINAYGNNFWRVRIHYVHEGKEYAKPIYLATDSMSHINYFYEDEWYYFNRFGCDVPLAIDLKKRSSYDLDYDGFPDSDKFDFVSKIDNRYDWDGDGVADRSDTLPTVTGTCAYDDVVGVPDSDEDGLCDPGHLNFKRKF